METKYETKVMAPKVLDYTAVISPQEDSISPNKEKEDRMNSEIKQVRNSFVFTHRGARLRFDSKKQAEIQWRICNP